MKCFYLCAFYFSLCMLYGLRERREMERKVKTKRKRKLLEDTKECLGLVIKVQVPRVLTDDSGKVNGVYHLNKH